MGSSLVAKFKTLVFDANPPRTSPPPAGAGRSSGCLSPGRGAAAADEPDTGQPSRSPTNKLTLAYYDFSSGKTGADVNLRHTFASSTAWIGAYHESDHFDQVRVGYEYHYHRDWLTLVPSAQAATHGFFGATIYGEAGRRFFGIGGAGRTNLQPYWNLGFDPNDYVQFGAGYRTTPAMPCPCTRSGTTGSAPDKRTRTCSSGVTCLTAGG